MNGWDGYSSGSGAEHEPSEERGQASWSAPEPGSPPPWASAETQTSQSPPPWAATPAPPPTWTPPPAYATAPVPAAGHGVRRLLLALTVTVVLGAGAGGGFWYVTRDHNGGTGTGAGPATSVSVTTSAHRTTPRTTPPATTSSASPLSTASSAAAGYRTAKDPIGYTVDVPQGWTRREKQGEKAPIVYYDSPDDGRQLQIFEVSEKTPAESLDLAENDPGYGFARQPGYQALDRTYGDTWAELSYRYDDQDKGARQVVDHRFTASDGTLYAIRVSGPETLSPTLVREPLVKAVGSFCPAGTGCS